MDTYTVEFRIEGTSLVPLNVTKLLRLYPCQTRDMTSNKESKRHRTPFWAYDGISSESKFVEQEWKSLEDGLLFLLDKLSPKRELIWSEFSGHKIYWWCGHFQQSFDGGPTFSSELLKKLAEFGAELRIRTYQNSG